MIRFKQELVDKLVVSVRREVSINDFEEKCIRDIFNKIANLDFLLNQYKQYCICSDEKNEQDKMKNKISNIDTAFTFALRESLSLSILQLIENLLQNTYSNGKKYNSIKFLIEIIQKTENQKILEELRKIIKSVDKTRVLWNGQGRNYHHKLVGIIYDEDLYHDEETFVPKNIYNICEQIFEIQNMFLVFFTGTGLASISILSTHKMYFVLEDYVNDNQETFEKQKDILYDERTKIKDNWRNKDSWVDKEKP